MEPSESNPTKKIRLDKWLKISRIFKTRALATRACEDGKIKVNDKKAKPATTVHIGDKVTVKKRSKYRSFAILDIVQKNISKKDAKFLYKEDTPQLSDESKELFELLQQWDKAGKRKYKGRPTKKERREMEKIRKF